MKDERARGEVCGKPSVLLCIPPRLQPYCTSYMEKNPREEPVTVYTAPQPVFSASTKNLERSQHFSFVPKPRPSVGPGDGKGKPNN